MKKQIWKIR